jgi:hypothetical protein
MEPIEITNELLKIKSSLMDGLLENLRKLPKETAAEIITDMARDVDSSFYALQALANEIVRSK